MPLYESFVRTFLVRFTLAPFRGTPIDSTALRNPYVPQSGQGATPYEDPHVAEAAAKMQIHLFDR
jgi:hypothetical protein